MTQYTAFHLRDMVAWNDDCCPPSADQMRKNYGQGPFKVVAVRLHTDEAIASNPKGHPEAVTIELKNKDRKEFSGSWFKKTKKEK